MAHVGDKGALGLARRFGGHPGLLQFLYTGLDRFFQMMAVLIQFLGKALLVGNVLLHRHIVADAYIDLADRRDPGQLGIFAAVLAPVDAPCQVCSRTRAFHIASKVSRGVLPGFRILVF